MKGLSTMNTTPEKTNGILEHVCRIAAAYIVSNKTPLEEVSAVITHVFQALASI